MARQGIVPIELELTKGTAYTLWAPSWREGGAEWQALLGADDDVYLFDSAEELLAFLRSGAHHDFQDHPQWRRFVEGLPESAVAQPRDNHDMVGLPAILAHNPDYDHVSRADRILKLSRAIGSIADLKEVQHMFGANSILAAVENGAEHFQGSGINQWSAVGRVILANWNECLDEFDTLVGHAPSQDEDSVKAATAEFADAKVAAEQRRKAAEEEKSAKEEKEKKEAAAADPYDSTVWAAAGIDPIKISIAGRNLYTLRCYLGKRPVFLGHAGEIHTFSQPRTMVRWLLENNEHDLAGLVTWDDIVTAANAGELEATVHPDNEYSFTGITADIKKGPSHIDANQLSRAYELLADAADWAGDDGVNEVLAANEQLQWLLNYMLDTGEQSEPVPPFDDEAAGWERLEKALTDRFTTKI